MTHPTTFTRDDFPGVPPALTVGELLEEIDKATRPCRACGSHHVRVRAYHRGLTYTLVAVCLRCGCAVER